MYAEKLGKAAGDITPDMIPTLSKNLQRHYSSQRKAYYQAEYVKHVARETFADGDSQFTALKEMLTQASKIHIMTKIMQQGMTDLKLSLIGLLQSRLLNLP